MMVERVLYERGIQRIRDIEHWRNGDEAYRFDGFDSSNFLGKGAESYFLLMRKALAKNSAN